MIETHLKNIEATIAAIRSELPKPRLPNVIPIVDCLWPDAMMKDHDWTYYENVGRGLGSWYGIVDSAIVVTKPGNDLYGRIDSQFTGRLDIIPGYKSVNAVEYAFDWDGWLKFFVAIATFVNERKPPRMLLDIEATIKDYVLGGGTANTRVIEQFAAMLRTLPCEFWIYPPPYWPGRDISCQERLRLNIVKPLDGDNVRFISQRHQSPSAVFHESFRAADQWAADNLTDTDFPEQVFFYGDDAYWPDDRFIECLQLIADQVGDETDVLVYPGHARFVEASRVLSAALKEAKP